MYMLECRINIPRAVSVAVSSYLHDVSSCLLLPDPHISESDGQWLGNLCKSRVASATKGKIVKLSPAYATDDA